MNGAREEYRKILLGIKPDIDPADLERAIDRMIEIENKFAASFGGNDDTVGETL